MGNRPVTGQKFGDRHHLPVLALIAKDNILQYLGCQTADEEQGHIAASAPIGVGLHMLKPVHCNANTEFFKCLAGDACRPALAIFPPAARQIQHVGKGNVRPVVPAIDQKMIIDEDRDFRTVKIRFAGHDAILTDAGLFDDQHDLADMIAGLHMGMRLGGIGEWKALIHHRLQFARFHFRPDVTMQFIRHQRLALSRLRPER